MLGIFPHQNTLLYVPSLSNMPYFFPDMQMNLELLGNGAASDARQHVKVTQTKGAVECAGNFPCFACVRLDSSRPAVSLQMIMWRENTRFASPTCSEHQMFPRTFFFFFSKPSCRDLASRCLCVLGRRGRFTWSCYILISRFKFSLSPRICCHGGTGSLHGFTRILNTDAQLFTRLSLVSHLSISLNFCLPFCHHSPQTKPFFNSTFSDPRGLDLARGPTSLG